MGDSHFGPELMLQVIASGARFVEVPVNSLPCGGRSAVTGDGRKAFALGVQMIGFGLRFRLASLGRTRPRVPSRRVEYGRRESGTTATMARQAAN